MLEYGERIHVSKVEDPRTATPRVASRKQLAALEPDSILLIRHERVVKSSPFADSISTRG
jgi:hypothetical protein